MILPSNGVITVNGSLDRETKDLYSVRVGVSIQFGKKRELRSMRTCVNLLQNAKTMTGTPFYVRCILCSTDHTRKIPCN